MNHNFEFKFFKTYDLDDTLDLTNVSKGFISCTPNYEIFWSDYADLRNDLVIPILQKLNSSLVLKFANSEGYIDYKNRFSLLINIENIIKQFFNNNVVHRKDKGPTMYVYYNKEKDLIKVLTKDDLAPTEDSGYKFAFRIEWVVKGVATE